MTSKISSPEALCSVAPLQPSGPSSTQIASHSSAHGLLLCLPPICLPHLLLLLFSCHLLHMACSDYPILNCNLHHPSPPPSFGRNPWSLVNLLDFCFFSHSLSKYYFFTYLLCCLSSLHPPPSPTLECKIHVGRVFYCFVYCCITSALKWVC